jgi:hypothetical protein
MASLNEEGSMMRVVGSDSSVDANSAQSFFGCGILLE